MVDVSLLESLFQLMSPLVSLYALTGELQQRLETIDKAQANIEKLSGNVLGLQDILSNKQTRGAFGEIQLNDIVLKALPSDAFTMQATLSNGRRARRRTDGQTETRTDGQTDRQRERQTERERERKRERGRGGVG